MSLIEGIQAREILDSRGNPTVEADVVVNNEVHRASVASGASTGTYEVLELRDGEERYLGKGVLKAVTNINEIIAPEIIGLDCRKQREIDNLMLEIDGTENKKKLGANAILAVSLAIAKAGAKDMKIPLYRYLGDLAQSEGVTLPIPQMNVINGGLHAGIKNDIQEHLIIPIGAHSFEEALRICTETYFKLKELLMDKFGVMGIHLGDEGGFVPPMDNIRDRLKIITQAIEALNYEDKIALGLDAAASEFYNEGKYTILNREYSAESLIDFYEELVKEFNIVSIEDGMNEDDWVGWSLLNQRLGKKIRIVGDDLFVTNINRINKGINLNVANSIILKVNQIGTVTESIAAAKIAQKAGWTVIVSHRSGETEDTFISDLVVGLDAGFSKFGAPARTDRNAKYNQLLRIEKELGYRAKYGIKKIFG